MWGLWWTECHWDRFWEYFGFPCHNHCTSDPELSCHLRYVLCAIYSSVKITYVFIMKAQCASCEWYKSYGWSSYESNVCFCSREQADIYSFSFTILSSQFLNPIGHNWCTKFARPGLFHIHFTAAAVTIIVTNYCRHHYGHHHHHHHHTWRKVAKSGTAIARSWCYVMQ